LTALKSKLKDSNHNKYCCFRNITMYEIKRYFFD